MAQQLEARAPDGGYGWVMVAVSFVINLIGEGIAFSFGVIFVEFVKYFDENRGKTAWIGSLFIAMPLLSGPIASFLTDRYGCRKVTMTGAVIASIGFALSSLANSTEMLFVTFGIIAGFGLSLCYVASVVIVAYYFDKKRSLATGLSGSGIGIGTFIFAQLTQALLEEYGWRGTTLILGGIFLNLAVCGALMRDLPWTPYEKAVKERLIIEKRKKDLDALQNTLSPNNNNTLQAGFELKESGQENVKTEQYRRTYRLSFSHKSSMFNLKRCWLKAFSCLFIYRNVMRLIAKETVRWWSGLWTFWRFLVNLVDFSHFSDAKFLVFAISNFLLYTWCDIPYIYLTDHAISIGISEYNASKLISAIGIINVVGEVIFGWAGDRPWINAGIIYAVCMGLCGAVTALVPLFSSYWSLSALSGAFGLFIAANYSLTCIILVELITLERFTNAYGLLLLVQGVANLVGPPLAGWLYDITGTYDLSFYLSGLFIAVSGLLLVIIPATRRFRRFKHLHSSDASSKGNHLSKEPKFHHVLIYCMTGKLNRNDVAIENDV